MVLDHPRQGVANLVGEERILDHARQLRSRPELLRRGEQHRNVLEQLDAPLPKRLGGLLDLQDQRGFLGELCAGLVRAEQEIVQLLLERGDVGVVRYVSSSPVGGHSSSSA